MCVRWVMKISIALAKKKWCRNTIVQSTNVNNNGATTTTESNMNETAQKASNLAACTNKKEQIKNLEREKMALKRENCRFKEENNDESEDPSCLTSKTNKSMEDVMTSDPHCRFGNKRMKKEVWEAMLKPDFYCTMPRSKVLFHCTSVKYTLHETCEKQ